jgi:hypothetical protein
LPPNKQENSTDFINLEKNFSNKFVIIIEILLPNLLMKINMVMVMATDVIMDFGETEKDVHKKNSSVLTKK